MIKKYLLFFLVCSILGGCAAAKKESVVYPRKPNDTSGRKAGAAMLLYEQAEKDSDVNENVIVTPPKEKPVAGKTSQ